MLFSYRRTIAIFSGLLLQSIAILPTHAQSTKLIATSQTTTQTTPGICPSQLSMAINEIIDRPELKRYRWGIVVKSLNGTNLLYNREGDKLFTPASNVKLITTAVALRQLGVSTRLRTSVYQLPSTGTAANLFVVGRGDPTLTLIQLQSIAQQLQQRGTKQIAQISFDDGYFRGEQTNGDWEWGDLSTDYAPPINSLMLGQNTRSLIVRPQQVGAPLSYTWSNPSLNNWQIDNQTQTVESTQDTGVGAVAVFGKPLLRLTGTLGVNGSAAKIDLPVANPSESFVNAFRQSLNQAGISVGITKLVLGQSSSNLPEIASISSPTIGELIKETNQKSNNIYAEVLLKSIGRSHPQHANGSDDTTSFGISMVKQRLTELGVNSQSYRLDDGSGLSRHDLVAPSAFTQLLTAMANTPEGKVYRDSLPVAGVSGTLKNRMKGTAAQGIVQAKTGSMAGVISLSGYMNSPKYSPLVFSIILNQHDRPTSEMSQVIDRVVVAIARLKQC
jgi:serine-type D-Ala-D-Ala carboxypeptidase/endopeptidase (penicillin-binding protein 4)